MNTLSSRESVQATLCLIQNMKKLKTFISLITWICFSDYLFRYGCATFDEDHCFYDFNHFVNVEEEEFPVWFYS